MVQHVRGVRLGKCQHNTQVVKILDKLFQRLTVTQQHGRRGFMLPDQRKQVGHYMPLSCVGTLGYGISNANLHPEKIQLTSQPVSRLQGLLPGCLVTPADVCWRGARWQPGSKNYDGDGSPSSGWYVRWSSRAHREAGVSETWDCVDRHLSYCRLVCTMQKDTCMFIYHHAET